MPELPEVEAARLAAQEHCVGKKVVDAQVADDRLVVEGLEPNELAAALKGRTLIAAKRKGKNLWFELDQRPWPTFHFGMGGAMLVRGVKTAVYKRALVSDSDEWPPKYLKLLLKFEGGLELAFTDVRRLARIRLQQDPTAEPPVSELGWDALLELPSEEQFTTLLSSRKGPIKALLLDQGFSAGIGNWVADEVLYQARIHPQEVAGNLSAEQCSRLRSAISTVLQTAVDVGGDPALFPPSWIFHAHGKKKGPSSVDGRKVEYITVGGRTSAFVPSLQIKGGSSAGAAPRKATLTPHQKGNTSKKAKPQTEVSTKAEGEAKGGKRVQAEKKKSKKTAEEDTPKAVTKAPKEVKTESTSTRTPAAKGKASGKKLEKSSQAVEKDRVASVRGKSRPQGSGKGAEIGSSSKKAGDDEALKSVTRQPRSRKKSKTSDD